MTFSGSKLLSFLQPMEIAKPDDKTRQALLDRHLWYKAKVGLRTSDIGEGLGDIAWLQRRTVLDGFAPATADKTIEKANRGKQASELQH